MLASLDFAVHGAGLGVSGQESAIDLEMVTAPDLGSLRRVMSPSCGQGLALHA